MSLLLIDGNNLVFRAYFAFERQNLRTSAGVPTGAVFGFARMLVKLLREQRPTHVAAAFDISSDTFRRRRYPQYKAQRRPTPPDLIAQLPVARRLCAALGITALTNPEFEADDLIGTLAARPTDGLPVTIVSGDRDLLQLLDERVSVELCTKGLVEIQHFDPAVFVASYGFPPDRLPDLKGLMGDASDNLPGVRGIGEKKAMPLIRQFGGIDELYRRLDEVANPRLRTQLAEGRTSAELSRELAVIRRDVPDVPPLARLAWPGWSAVAPIALPLLRELQFDSLARELAASVVTAVAPPAGTDTDDGAGRTDGTGAVGASGSELRLDSESVAGPGAVRPAVSAMDAVASGLSAVDAPGPATDSGPVAPRETDVSRRHSDGNGALSPVAGGGELPAAEGQGPPQTASLPGLEGALAVEGPVAAAGDDTARLGSLGAAVACLHELAAVERFLAASRDRPLAIDLETTGFDPFTDRIVGISLAFAPDAGVYLPLRHAGLGFAPNLDPDGVARLLRPVLATRPLIGHNLKFDLQFLAAAGLPVAGPLTDTLLLAYVGDPTRSNGLKALGQRLLRVEVQDFDDVVKRRGRGGFAEVPPAEAAVYGVQDVILTLRLLPLLTAEVAACGAEAVVRDLELPLIPILCAMESQGIGLDQGHLERLGVRLAAELQRLEQSIHGHAGFAFNVNSPKQLREVLYQHLALPKGHQTRSGASTDSDELTRLRSLHPIATDLLQYRELAKLKSTYVEALLRLRHPRTGLIHTTFNQTVTATGRLSSSNPNLQNIPVKTEWGREVRRAFLPPRSGSRFISLDYSQIELRLLAHCSADPVLLDAFATGRDIHAMTAARIFGCEVGAVTEAQRKVGKTVNFGILYGISAHGLAADLGITRPAAQAYIDGFFAAFPGVAAWLDLNLAAAREKGRVATIFGRIRPLPELAASSRQTRAFGERVARNTPLQGSAADLVKKAMIDADRELRAAGLATRPVLQIHDELVFDVPPAELATAAELLRATMEGVVPLRVPLVCDVSVGDNLADLAPWPASG